MVPRGYLLKPSGLRINGSYRVMKKYKGNSFNKRKK